VRNDTPILLRDVAEVKIAPALRSGDSLIMGKPGVMLSLASQYGANTLTATLAVEKALGALEPALKSRGRNWESRGLYFSPWYGISLCVEHMFSVPS